jgi:hypothetical protein
MEEVISKNQMDELETALKKYAEIAHTLPTPPTNLMEPEDYCACGKVVPITKFDKLNTGVKVIYNNVCNDCPNGKKLDKETARVVCCKCKRVVARLQPGTDEIDGFVIKPGMSLHLMHCSNCDGSKAGDNKEYQIIEKIIWQRKNGPKRNTLAT